MKNPEHFQKPDSGVCDDLHALVARILASTVFEKSVRLREFFRYICDRALDGHPEEVHEQLIGHRVFNRPINYNPADENIVRVSARQLRNKLREYYDTYGQGERWLVEIPKGGYLPVFRERGPGGSNSAETTTDRQGQPTPTANFLTDLFGSSREPLYVVISDSALVLMQALVRHRFTLEEYADRTYREFPQELPDHPDIRQFWRFLGTRQLANIGDVGAATRLLTSMSGHRPNVSVRNARNMTARDFMRGNFVLLGSSYSNPWTNLFFERQLNFQFSADEMEGETELRNLRPRAGELEVYSSKGRAWVGGVSYAHVALVSNLTKTGRVLLVAGITMEATEAAAGFLLNPSSSRQLLQILGNPKPALTPDFEVLLETSALDGTPNSVRVITHRVYPPNSSAQTSAQ